MSMFQDPFDAKSLLARRCPCGGPHSSADHDRLAALAIPAGEEERWARVVDAAVLRAVFPVDAQRRVFLKTVGAATAMAAISSVLPLGSAREAFAQGGTPEKRDLKVGFIPITCATPIIMAHPMGFYAKQGLNVEVVKTAGWAVIRDKSLAKEYDAAHMLSPMPLAITMGLGSTSVPYVVPAIENINGQAITLAIKHKDKRDPKDWKIAGKPMKRLEIADKVTGKPIFGIEATAAHVYDQDGPVDVALHEIAAWWLARELGSPWSGMVAPAVWRSKS